MINFTYILLNYFILIFKSDPLYENSFKDIFNFKVQIFDILQKIDEYKDSKFCKFYWWIHYCDISCLSVSHKVHHTKSVTLLNLLTDSWCEINVDKICWNKYQSYWPKKSSFFTFESFQSWEFSEEYDWNQHYSEDTSNNIIDEIHSAWPSFCLFGVKC